MKKTFNTERLEYAIGAYLTERMPFFGKKREQLFEQEPLSLLYPREDWGEVRKRLWGRRAILLAVFLLLAGLVWIVCFTEKTENPMFAGDARVIRQEEDASLSLRVTGEDDTGEWQEEVSVNVKVREFSDKEKEDLDKRVGEYVERMLAGQNESLQHIEGDLCFVSQIPDTDIVMTWIYDETYFKSGGQLRSDRIPEEGVDTDIQMEAGWRNWSKTYSFAVHIEPVVLKGQEKRIQEVRKAIRMALKEQSEKGEVQLPEQVKDTALDYSVAERKKNYTPFFVVLGICFLLPVCWKERQKKQMQLREEQMFRDHPGIVNKIMLLLSAGLSLQKSVERIAAEYEMQRREGGEIRYAYEEICILQQEMKDGISEAKAVERFGRRCRLLPYLRFSAVVTQNLKKGAEGILDILEQESMEALQKRRDRALQQGEKAGTKLLLPMMLMLGLVMGLIMVPAFMSM